MAETKRDKVLWWIIGIFGAIIAFLAIQIYQRKESDLSELKQGQKTQLELLYTINNKLSGQDEKIRGMDSNISQIQEDNHKQWRVINNICLHRPCNDYASIK